MALVRIRCLSHLNATNKRKVTLATAKQIVVADNFDNERMSNLSSEIIKIYDFSISNMTVNGKEYNNLRQEPDLFQLNNKGDDEELWKAAWYLFRNEQAPKIRNKYIEYKELSNKWAKKGSIILKFT